MVDTWNEPRMGAEGKAAIIIFRAPPVVRSSCRCHSGGRQSVYLGMAGSSASWGAGGPLTACLGPVKHPNGTATLAAQEKIEVILTGRGFSLRGSQDT